MSTPERLQRALDRERTARKHAEQLLENRSRELFLSKQALEAAYTATVEVFSSLFGERSGRSAESLRRLGHRTRQFALELGLNQDDAQTLYLAAILCDIGKLALPDSLTSSPVVRLDKDEFQLFRRHPEIAHDALMVLQPLEKVAETIYQHCELIDGSGYPQGLKGDEIQLLAKVLCVAKDFDALLRGKLLDSCLTTNEAIEYLSSNKSSRYDAEIVDRFLSHIVNEQQYQESLQEQKLTAGSLRAGMALTRDLCNDQGILILPAGQLLTEILVEKLRKIAKRQGDQMLVYVEQPPAEEPGDNADVADKP